MNNKITKTKNIYVSRSEIAEKYFTSGYNCAQAVLLSFSEKLGLEEETLLKLSSSFGGGMGRLREVCGALSAGFTALGLLYGYTDSGDKEAKVKHYERIQKLAYRFKEENGSIICRELLKEAPAGFTPSDRTAAYYQARPCAQLVAEGARLLEELICEIESGKA